MVTLELQRSTVCVGEFAIKAIFVHCTNVAFTEELQQNKKKKNKNFIVSMMG